MNPFSYVAEFKGLEGTKEESHDTTMIKELMKAIFREISMLPKLKDLSVEFTNFDFEIWPLLLKLPIDLSLENDEMRPTYVKCII